MPPTARRFRPSAAALDGARAYVPRAAMSPPKKAPAAPTVHTQALRTSKKKWSSGDSRAGRFIRRYNGGRLATHESERTLVHIVTTFAIEVARAAAECSSAGGAAEEGDLRRVLGQALPLLEQPAMPAAGGSATGARAGQRKGARASHPHAQPLHASLLEEAVT